MDIISCGGSLTGLVFCVVGDLVTPRGSDEDTVHRNVAPVEMFLSDLVTPSGSEEEDTDPPLSHLVLPDRLGTSPQGRQAQQSVPGGNDGGSELADHFLHCAYALAHTVCTLCCISCLYSQLLHPVSVLRQHNA